MGEQLQENLARFGAAPLGHDSASPAGNLPHRGRAARGSRGHRGNGVARGGGPGAAARERSANAFYRRWEEFTNADRWAEIALAAVTARLEGAAMMWG